MYAGSSPPPQEIDGLVSASASTSTPATPAPFAPTSQNNTNLTSTNQHSSTSVPPLPAHNRKRKRGGASTAHAASPAPSDQGSAAGNGNGGNDLLGSRVDLYSRPILSISRGPFFIPISEGLEWYRTDSVGVNRVGYRYVPAGINPPGFITPCRTIESNPTSFRVSWEDRSPLLRVTKDGLSLAGFRGFRTARCNAPMREGKWYLEVKIIQGGGDRGPDSGESSNKKEGNHVRLGWGRREASLNGPVGLDGYSYGYRDKTGDKVTLSRPRPYGSSFKSGDVVGMYISLPPLRQPAKKDAHDPAHIHRERIPIDLKGQEVFEILEYPVSKEMTALMDYSGKSTNSASLPSTAKKAVSGAKLPDRSPGAGATGTGSKVNTPSLRPLPTLPHSRIAFFVNGECQGTAFEELYDFLPLKETENQRQKSKERSRRAREGVKEHRENPFDDGTLGYYPMISLFNDAMVKINPGPEFEFLPPADIDALLDGKPQPDDPQPRSDPPSHLSETKQLLEMGKAELTPPIKSESEPTSLDIKMDVDAEVKPPATNFDSISLPPNRTWRPAIERYPEFMQEQWNLDALEEEEAKAEFDKQKAKEEAAAIKGAKRSGNGGEKRNAGTSKAAPSKSRKKQPHLHQEEEEKAVSKATVEGQPPDEEPVVATAKSVTGGASTARSRKKAKKAEGQFALGVSAPQVQGLASVGPSSTAPSVPHSMPETPFGTPPPPSISSTAAAAAAAAVHLHYHHSLARSESHSNRPSPSPLRQSTAYRETRTGEEGEVEGGEGKDTLPTPPPPTSTAPNYARPKKHPGSKEGRHHAQVAAAAAAATGIIYAPTVSPLSQGRGNVMSLISTAGTTSQTPGSPPGSAPAAGKAPSSAGSSRMATTPSASNTSLLAPPPRHRATAKIGAHPATSLVSRPASRAETMSVGGSVYNDAHDDDNEDEHEGLEVPGRDFASAGGYGSSAAGTPGLEGEDEDFDMDNEREASEYGAASAPEDEDGQDDNEEDREREIGISRGEDDEATTDGDGDSVYPYHPDRGEIDGDVDMLGDETDDGGGTVGDEIEIGVESETSEDGTAPQSPEA